MYCYLCGLLDHCGAECGCYKGEKIHEVSLPYNVWLQVGRPLLGYGGGKRAVKVPTKEQLSMQASKLEVDDNLRVVAANDMDTGDDSGGGAGGGGLGSLNLDGENYGGGVTAGRLIATDFRGISIPGFHGFG